MPSIFITKIMKEPKEWYDTEVGNDIAWEYDKILDSYHAGYIYMSVRDDSVAFQDMSELMFMGWDRSAWIELADGNELRYGYYNEDNLEAEFVHIKDGKCVRDYREYDGEVESDEGTLPVFTDWVDVSMFIDENLL